MSATFVIPYLPTSLTGLIAKLTPVDGAPTADPAGYALVDTSELGLYTGSVPPYLSVQPSGKYWCRVFLPGRDQPAVADYVQLVNGQTVILGDLPVPLDPSVSEALDLAMADSYIDSRQIPWREVRIKRGTGTLTSGQVLLVRELFDIAGVPIDRINKFVAVSRGPLPEAETPPDGSIRAEDGSYLADESGIYIGADVDTLPPDSDLGFALLTESGDSLVTESGDLLLFD